MGEYVKQKKRIRSYDGLKGLSIIAIIFYHLFPNLVPGGFLTVNTFFALGGYFFVYKVEKFDFSPAKRDFKAVFKYIKQTIGRLFFPLWWMIGLVVVFLLIFNRDELMTIRNDIFSGLFFYNNLYQIAADKSYFVRMTEASPFTHLWYNSLYLQSFILTIIGVLATKYFELSGAFKAVIWGIVAYLSHSLLIILYQPGSDPSRVYYGLDTRYSSFILGVMMAYAIPVILNLFYRFKAKKVLYLSLGAVSLAVYLVLPFIITDQQPETYYFIMPLYSVMSSFLILALALGVPFARMIFDFPVFSWIGKRSYSYYLWYYPVIAYWMNFQRQFEKNEHWLYLGIGLTIFLLAELTYQLIERQKLVLPFVTSFEWKKDWHQFKINNRSPWLIGGSVVFVLLTTFAMAVSRNDKPLALFRLEYQFEQTQPSMFEVKNKAEREIVKVQSKVMAWEKALDAQIVSKVKTVEFMDTVKAALVSTNRLSADVNNIVAEHQAILDEIASYDEALADLVPDDLEIFASKLPVSFFGDSIMLLDGKNAENMFLQADTLGVKSLQIWAGVDYLRDWIASGAVHEILVVNLGTNAGLDDQGMEDLIATAGDRKIFFVNTNSDVPHKDSVNQIIKAFADKYENVYEIDWFSYSQGHPEFYWEGEDVHHTPEGADNYVLFIAQELRRVLGDQYVPAY